MMAVTEDWLVSVGLPGAIVMIVSVVRWIVLALAVMIGLDLVYKIVPAHARRFRWVSWGSLIATLMWIVVTALFFVYARYFAHFSDSYSLFAGIIVLMIWLNLSSLALLIGAAIDHAAEDK
jgi:membrane protein